MTTGTERIHLVSQRAVAMQKVRADLGVTVDVDMQVWTVILVTHTAQEEPANRHLLWSHLVGEWAVCHFARASKKPTTAVDVDVHKLHVSTHVFSKLTKFTRLTFLNYHIIVLHKNWHGYVRNHPEAKCVITNLKTSNKYYVQQVNSLVCYLTKRFDVAEISMFKNIIHIAYT